MNRISFLNRGYAFKGLLAVLDLQSTKKLESSWEFIQKNKCQGLTFQLLYNPIFFSRDIA